MKIRFKTTKEVRFLDVLKVIEERKENSNYEG